MLAAAALVAWAAERGADVAGVEVASCGGPALGSCLHATVARAPGEPIAVVPPELALSPPPGMGLEGSAGLAAALLLDPPAAVLDALPSLEQMRNESVLFHAAYAREVLHGCCAKELADLAVASDEVTAVAHAVHTDDDDEEQARWAVAVARSRAIGEDAGLLWPVLSFANHDPWCGGELRADGRLASPCRLRPGAVVGARYPAGPAALTRWNFARADDAAVYVELLDVPAPLRLTAAPESVDAALAQLEQLPALDNIPAPARSVVSAAELLAELERRRPRPSAVEDAAWFAEHGWRLQLAERAVWQTRLNHKELHLDLIERVAERWQLLVSS